MLKVNLWRTTIITQTANTLISSQLFTYSQDIENKILSVLGVCAVYIKFLITVFIKFFIS